MLIQPLNSNQGVTIDGPLLISPKVFADQRGFFLESWNQSKWNEVFLHHNQAVQNFVQDNHSQSDFGVLRGLHYQVFPNPQGKLVRCVMGEIFDVAVDLRCSSNTFGQWVGAKLSAVNQQQLWIPVGFAHGFLTLSDKADVLYKATNYWNRECERAIRWDDLHLGIDWPALATTPKLSEKDCLAPMLSELVSGDLFE